MTTALMSVIAGIIALLAVFYLYRKAGPDVHNHDKYAAQLRSIDVEAFRNLVDKSEQEFLRQSLPWRDYRLVHCERMLAAAEYIRAAFRNAGILIYLAEGAIADSDPTIAAAANNLRENATRVRLYALRAVPQLYISIAFPGIRYAPQFLAERYDVMTRQGVTLNCLRSPVHAISAR